MSNLNKAAVIATQRIISLDYLRGYAALLIMIYHYLSWSNTTTQMDYFFAKMGYYGVEVFYILSGYTLAHVYVLTDFTSIVELKSFYLKRIFRIFPLLWLVIILTIFLNRDGIPDLNILLINLTGVFSVYRIDEYIAMGSWSIGNEIFFYLLFPFLLLVKSKKGTLALLSIILCCFTVFLIPSFNPLTKGDYQWKQYINPINHLAFFYSGVLIHRYKPNWPSKWSILAILMVLIILIIIPITNRIDLIFGLSRIVYSVGMIILVISFIAIRRYKNSVAHKISEHIGKISYSLYLLHPLVWGVSAYFLNQNGIERTQEINYLRIVFSTILTLILSGFVYHYLELKFMKLGKSLVIRR